MELGTQDLGAIVQKDYGSQRQRVSCPRSWPKIVQERYGHAERISPYRFDLYRIDGREVSGGRAATAVVKYTGHNQVPKIRQTENEVTYGGRYSGRVGLTIFRVTKDTDELPEGIEIVMEEAFGSLIDSKLKGISFRKPEVQKNLAYAVAELLYELEGDNVSHCDVKPDNIFLCFDEMINGHYRLGDFGLTRSRDETKRLMSQKGLILGSPGYISPEFFSGAEMSHPTPDIFSYGGVLYWAISGCHPPNFDSTSHASRQRFGEQVESGKYVRILASTVLQTAPDIPREILLVLCKCLQPARKRPTSFVEILDILK